MPITREFVWVHAYDVVDMHARKDRNGMPGGSGDLNRAHSAFSAVLCKLF
eukprot:XP_001706711.1 Hypothetical protein GL50803_31673 [Giardia lamblia ATCC 50803]